MAEEDLYQDDPCDDITALCDSWELWLELEETNDDKTQTQPRPWKLHKSPSKDAIQRENKKQRSYCSYGSRQKHIRTERSPRPNHTQQAKQPQDPAVGVCAV